MKGSGHPRARTRPIDLFLQSSVALAFRFSWDVSYVYVNQGFQSVYRFEVEIDV